MKFAAMGLTMGVTVEWCCLSQDLREVPELQKSGQETSLRLDVHKCKVSDGFLKPEATR